VAPTVFACAARILGRDEPSDQGYDPHTGEVYVSDAAAIHSFIVDGLLRGRETGST
jgi:hypothetical protein